MFRFLSIKVFVILISSLLLSSCFLTIAAISTANTTTSKEVIIDNDNIIALGEATLPNINSPIVSLVGEKHTYLIFKNGNFIKEIATNLDGKFITINDGKPFEINSDKNNFNGKLLIKYYKEKSELSLKELILLKKNKFTKSHNFYQKSIEISGAVRNTPNNINDIKQRFKTKRKINFYAYDYQTEFDKSKIPLIATAVAFDMIIYPIYILGVFFYISDSNSD